MTAVKFLSNTGGGFNSCVFECCLFLSVVSLNFIDLLSKIRKQFAIEILSLFACSGTK
jgi:energy-converting hydrogenase Eha subunit H